MKFQLPDYVLMGAAGVLGAAWFLSSGDPEVTYHQDADGQIIATTTDENDVLTHENLGHSNGIRIYTDKDGNTLCARGDEACTVTPPELRYDGPGL